MGPDTSAAPPASAAERVARWLAAAALAASLAYTVHPWFQSQADASLYVATARAIAAGEGYSYLGEPFVLRPPGLSLLMAPVIAARGVDFYALNLWVSSFGAAGVVLLALFSRPRLGTPLALATAGVVLARGLWA